MASVNKAIIVGRLGKDPEIKYTQSGKAVANFSLATEERSNEGGDTKKKTEWHNVVIWDKLAEICGQYLKKGSLVYIEGKLQTRSWEDKDGKKCYTTEIVAHTMQMLGSKGQAEEASDDPGQGGNIPF